MKNYILKLILIFPLIIYCSDNKNIIGNEFPFRKISDMVFSKTISPTKTENIKISKNFGENKVLLLGREDAYKASIYIKFHVEMDLKIIKEAKMFLNNHSASTDVSEEFEALIYEITSDWNESDIQDIQVDPTAINSFIVNSTKIELDSIIIPPGLVQKWYNDSTSNKGMMISFQNANFVKRYFSRENLYEYPYMEVKGETDSKEETTIKVYPRIDTYRIVSDVHPEQSELVIDDLSIYRAAIRFDSINIPENATINMALLELEMNPEKSYLLGEDRDQLLGLKITSSSWSPDEIEFDNEFARGQQLSEFMENNKVEINISNIVQEWVSKISENYGLIIVSYNESINTGRYVFNLNDNNQQELIKLKIDYTVINPEQTF